MLTSKVLCVCESILSICCINVFLCLTEGITLFAGVLRGKIYPKYTSLNSRTRNPILNIYVNQSLYENYVFL